MRILFCTEDFPSGPRRLAALLPTDEVVACSPGSVLQHLEAVDILVPIVTPIGREIFEQGQFGLVQQFGVGLETVDVEAATRTGVWVARVPSAGTNNAESVAEHTVLLMLALSRHLPQARTALEAQRFGQPEGVALLGKTACIVGLGDIGTALAVRLRAFGMNIIAIREHPERGSLPATGIERVCGPDDLHCVLGSADYVAICIKYSERDHHFVDRAALAAMKPGAFLINIARGGLVDPEALLAALESGHLAGAGLDVFWEEPVDPKHPLFRHNVIATPHIAGVTDASYTGIARAVAQNIERYRRGEVPLYVVNEPPNPRYSIGLR